MHYNRPSYKELDKKIKGAKEALIERKGIFANVNKVVGELNELEMESSDLIWNLILELLDEISPEKYAGRRPPDKSYEKKIEKSELYAFCWNSKKLGKKMYIKFALKENTYYYVSLHKSKV